MSDRPPPKVSVCVMTYNQERFIGECLESIVTQEADFDVEVIVADDASTDGTAAIVRDYEARFPGRLRGIYHSKNVGVKANYLSAHDAARGEYVAHVDGDDILLPGKLKRQAAFLDAQPACAFVGSNGVLFSTHDDGSHRFEGYTNPAAHPEVMDFDGFVERNGFLFTHSSKMYRRALSPDVSGVERFIDVNLHVLQAANGDVGYIHDPLLKYRINAGISVGRDGYADHIASIETAERLGAKPESVRYAYARAAFEGALTALRAGKDAEFRRRIELSAVYGALRRRNDRLWRSLLYRMRDRPGALRRLLAFKESASRFRSRRGVEAA